MKKEVEKKIAEKIIKMAEGIASNTVNKSTWFQVYEMEVPDCVRSYLEREFPVEDRR